MENTSNQSTDATRSDEKQETLDHVVEDCIDTYHFEYNISTGLFEIETVKHKSFEIFHLTPFVSFGVEERVSDREGYISFELVVYFAERSLTISFYFEPTNDEFNDIIHYVAAFIRDVMTLSAKRKV
jgi:hypothetical protein